MIPDPVIFLSGIFVGSVLGVVAGIHWIVRHPHEFIDTAKERGFW